MKPPLPHYVLLSGGGGGAKFARGLAGVLRPGQLSVIGNTGDDFTHLGLQIAPDLDTLMYTLADRVNPDTGWGCKDETWGCMAGLAALGGESWFQLGDRDLATHLLRTRRVALGATLTEVTGELCAALGIGVELLPMTDSPVRTVLDTASGRLSFQEYFVRLRAAPRVRAVHFEGAANALLTDALHRVLRRPNLAGIFIGPSNPYLSIDPILSVPGLRAALAGASAPVIAISPVVGGRALKGPVIKLMEEFGVPPTAGSVARHYGALLDGFILDEVDRDEATPLLQQGLSVGTTATVMHTLEDRLNLARFALDFGTAR